MNKTLLTVILAIALSLTSCVTDDDPVNHGVIVGDPLPSFAATLSGGAVIDNQSLAGKTAIIEFFNTGCGDCRQSLPLLQTIYDQVKDDPDVIIVAIARDEDEDSISSYWSEHGLTIPYSPQPDTRVYSLFATVGIPRIYVVNPDGIIVSAYGPEDYHLLTLNQIKN